MLERIGSSGFQGKVGLFGPERNYHLQTTQKLGEYMGLLMLPVLPTPIAPQALRERLTAVLPDIDAKTIEVDVAEALNLGWLELWYQPKFDVRTLQITGVEALARIRHPEWGVLLPEAFLPQKEDPYLRVFSEFVVARALEDWRAYFGHLPGIDVAINLPVMFLKDLNCLAVISRQLPNDKKFGGLVVEIDAADLILNLNVANSIGKRLRSFRIATSVDDFAVEWPALTRLVDFPFAEIKVDRQLVSGCARDLAKRSALRRVVTVAHDAGARVVAEGVEVQADLLAVQKIGFDVVQGFLLARPMSASSLALSTFPAEAASAH